LRPATRINLGRSGEHRSLSVQCRTVCLYTPRITYVSLLLPPACEIQINLQLVASHSPATQSPKSNSLTEVCNPHESLILFVVVLLSSSSKTELNMVRIELCGLRQYQGNLAKLEQVLPGGSVNLHSVFCWCGIYPSLPLTALH
jgi:hypothetical protein